MTYSRALSGALAALRRQLGLRQVDVARRMGVDSGWISRLESGNGNPTAQTIDRYLDAVDCGPDELIAVLRVECALREIFDGRNESA
jgi:transcriptional regulator with XRE-family HTH domain